MDLLDKKVVITRPRSQAGELAAELREAGAIPLCFPVIEIAPLADPAELDRALINLPGYDWLVLTSANGVEAVWARLAALGIERLPEQLKVAAIGPKTATALTERGKTPDFVPAEFISEAIVPGMGELHGCRVLLPRAEIARKALPELIRQSGGFAHEISAYRTLPASPDPDALRALQAGVDILTFTSSSTVENFITLCDLNRLDSCHLPGNPLVACIGPITADTARQNGLNVHVIAHDYTARGLIQALREFDGD